MGHMTLQYKIYTLLYYQSSKNGVLKCLQFASRTGKKRKFADEVLDEAACLRSPKQRRVPQTPIQPPAALPPRAMQTLSPSLAMIVSPVDTEPSPRPAPSYYAGSGSSSSAKVPNSDSQTSRAVKLTISNDK